MRNQFKFVLSLILVGVASLGFNPALAKDVGDASSRPLVNSYHRLLPLDGGSNFRDLGGYVTSDGKTVVRGELFRSGVMSGLTEEDMNYLDQFHFKTVVDLRSSDEISLFPNYWAQTHHVNYVTYDYSFRNIANNVKGDGEKPSESHFSAKTMYEQFPVMLKPQLTTYFEQLLEHHTPLVVNCSAGQDRTGIASALLLTALGVPRNTIVEDYLLSTDYRNTANEMAGVNLKQAGEENEFAKMMLRYQKGDGEVRRAEVLKSADGVPYINYMFNEVEKEYGSVANYMDKELGVDANDVAKLRSLYLK